MAKGSLLPENAVGIARVPDGDYTIKTVQAHMFDYGGTQEEAPAGEFLFDDGAGETYEQNYTAGKGAKLMDPPDGKRFDVIGKNSNLALMVASFLKAGFPKDKLDDDITVFQGYRVSIVNTPPPVRNFKDGEKKDQNPIPLVTKILALPGSKSAARPMPAKSVVAQVKSVPSATPVAGNGEPSELDTRTIEVIQQIVATAPDNTITRLKLGTAIMLTLKAKDPNMAAIKKLATDGAWLQANAELGGWTSDGETLVLG